jgi:hypothetical protein
MIGEFLLLLLSFYDPQVSGYLAVIFSVARSLSAAYKCPKPLPNHLGVYIAFQPQSAFFYVALVLKIIRPW